MQFPAVNWHEGLFLHPHHFQAWDRHWTERVATGEQWQNPFSYGIAELAINSSALAAGFFQIDALRCKTPTGTLIEFTAGRQAERRDLREALDASLGKLSTATTQPGSSQSGRAARVDVFLGVPRLQLGSPNVDPVGHRNGSRFLTECLDVPDEVDAASVKPVEFRKLNAKILFSHEDLAGYDTIRLARVERGSRDGAVAQLDNHYIPPLVDCGAWPWLRNEILSPIHDWLLQLSELSAQQVQDTGGTLHASTPIDVQRLLLLQVTNPSASVLKVLLHSRGIHPLQAYLEVARIAGAFDLFSGSRSSQATDAYDHENLGPIFHNLKRRIQHSIQSLVRLPYNQRYFVGNDSGMQVTLDRSEIGLVSRWYIGIHKGDLSIDSLDELLSAGHLDWKLGSLDQVEWLFTHRAPGVELKRAKNPPASLPRGTEWVYYEVAGTDSAAWGEVEKSGSLAMRIKDSLIVDAHRLPGSRTLIVDFARQPVSLQFALFGVR